MKTKTQITTLFLILSLMFATNSFAVKRDIKFEEETYIDDIPFDTERVVNELMSSDLDFEEEAYVEDIPFNTSCLVANLNYNNATAVAFVIEDEAYVDDIPFDTYEVANSVSVENKLNLLASGR